jgi:hypothetical protein
MVSGSGLLVVVMFFIAGGRLTDARFWTRVNATKVEKTEVRRLTTVSNTIEKPKPLTLEQQKLIAEAQKYFRENIERLKQIALQDMPELEAKQERENPILKNAVQFGDDFRVRFLKRTNERKLCREGFASYRPKLCRRRAQ